MPVVPESYDRRPLTRKERVALLNVAQLHGFRTKEGMQAKRDLKRLETPLLDVMTLHTSDRSKFRIARKLLYTEMAYRGSSFWEWTDTDWIDIICPTYQDFEKKYGPQNIRQPLVYVAYLLGEMKNLWDLDQNQYAVETAQYIFGSDVLEKEWEKITDVLVGKEGLGYSGYFDTIKRVKHTLSLLFLMNRSPYVTDLSQELLQQVAQWSSSVKKNNNIRFALVKIATALQELGMIQQPEKKQISRSEEERDTSGVPEEWVRWCRAWLKRYPKVTTHLRWCFGSLLTVGRWLAHCHPDVVSPQQWNEELALEYVNYLCTTATAGDYISPAQAKRQAKKGFMGKPLTPRTIDKKMSAVRLFFIDLQRQPHAIDETPPHKIEPRFNPREIFLLPSSIKKLIQPDPRDIDEIIWCKLTYAAATLTEEDYSVSKSGYPLTYYRAAALLWVTSARRPGEITRLQVGCIRRDWDPAMLDEHGIPLPGQEAQLCYLHIPSGKTKGPYWVPIPKYTADAVEAWEKERPLNQSKQIDAKDNAEVNFLFCLRGKRMGTQFINASLIRVLCNRAGIPENDARGAITGHRARSTIATMLRRNGLSLEDIAEFLGHTTTQMVRAYARTDQFRFGRDMNRANNLMRIVEGVIDIRAGKVGKPNVFFFLGRGSDGQPRFCGNPAWDKCKHRLACLKCPMYVGGGPAARLAERLEARDELFKFQTQVEMTPQEKAATEGDIETLSSLIDADANVPPPELPGDQFRFNTSHSIPENSPPQEVQGDLVSLGRELASLNRELADAESKADGRNANVRALKKRIARVTEQMLSLDQITSLTTESLGV